MASIFWIVTSLNEPFKSATKVFAADRLVRAKNPDCTCEQ